VTERELLCDVVTDICVDLAAPRTDDGPPGSMNTRVWNALADAGLTTVSIPESQGGVGGCFGDALAVLEVLAEYAVAVPQAETSVLGGWMLGAAGHPLPRGPVSAAVGHADDHVELVRTASTLLLRGQVVRVPWARASERIAVRAATADGDVVLSIDPRASTLVPIVNLAGEPRDTLLFDDIPIPNDAVRPAPPGVDVTAVRIRGALARAVMLSAAMMRIVDTTVEYAATRHQFGRPINRFQAVQFLLVRLAEQAACADTATRVAVLASHDGPAEFESVVAKAVASDAAGIVAATAHQVHGAIGMTQEYPLHLFTTRLWSWRDEFGSEDSWARELGGMLIAGGAGALWPTVARDLVVG
jgi:acyl-CoA dehydrogenase